ncbi:uncharacterized protein LOC144345056 [Saccoglossus kowalevskii]
MDSPSKFSGKRKRTRVLCSPFHKPVTPQSKTRRLPPKLKNGKVGPLVPGLGFVIGQILHLRRKGRFKLVQGLNSIQMYRSGCSHKLQTWFNKLGISMGIKGTRGLIDRLRKQYDSDIMKWKSMIQDDTTITGPPLYPYTVDSESLDDWEDTEDENNDTDDSVVDTSTDESGSTTPMHIMDYSSESLDDNTDDIGVNLGVIQQNPSSGRGVIEIMKILNQYVPRINGKPFPLICHGDQLSVERMVGGRIAMAASEGVANRLVGLEPRPQEFHKRCILDQDDDLDDDREYCTCDGEGDVDSLSMIECSAQKNCECAQWYHFECVGLDEEDDLLKDWWCSDGYKNGLFIVASGTERKRRMLYGLVAAMKLVVLIINDGDWFFCQDCRISFNDSEEMDSINEHSCAVTWRGLYHLANRDAERQNDGQALISNWKINMLDFWNNNHNKYLILGHPLLSCMYIYLMNWRLSGVL